MTNYFTSEHFKLLNKWQKQKRDTSNPEQNRAYESLQEAYLVTERWANEVQRKLFSDGCVEVRKRPTNQGNNFLSYNWARIYPEHNSPKTLAYTVGIDAEYGFIVKIDTVGLSEIDPVRRDYLNLRNGLKQSPIVAVLPASKGLEKSLTDLVEWSIQAIESFQFRYDEVAEKLNLIKSITDEELLAHFDQKLAFKKARSSWKAEQQKLFCRLARVVHEAGLDWWHSGNENSVSVGFGRKHPDALRAERILGRVRGKHKRTLSWLVSIGSMPKVSRESLTEKLVDQIEEALLNVEKVPGGIFNKLLRSGLWPDQLSEEVDSQSMDDEDDDVPSDQAAESEPLNRIYYGPPGTGKTYRLQELTKQYTLESSSLTHEQWLQDQLKDDSWFEVVFMCMYDLHNKGPVKAGDVEEHPFFVAKAQLLGRQKNLRAQVWAVLQTHTLEDSETVKYSRRAEPQVFDKIEQGQWTLAGNWQEETAHLIERAVYLQSGQPQQEERKNYELVTFHQAYSYEDFVEGLRPEYNDEKASLEYLVKPGVFWQICHKAKLNPEVRFAIFIDEINRGNIAQIFGELITLIEIDKRAVYDQEGQLVGGMELTLPYSQNTFGVPRNLDIYGSMNTADRSIALLDTALRRRFRFEELMPKPELIEGADGAGCIDDGQGGVIDLRQLLNMMNERIEFLLHRDLTLGHAYFCSVTSFNELCDVMTQQVIPLLQEYFYNDWQRIQLVFNDIQSGDRPVEPQIIQHKIWNAGEVLGSEQDEDLGESRSYWVNPVLTPQSLRKIYQKHH